MLRLLTVAACALVVGGGFAIPRLGFATSAPPGKAAALQRLGSVATTDSNTEPVVPPDAAVRPISARMLGPASPIPIPPSVLRVRNGWLMSDGRTLVAVYAGAAGNDPSVGRLVVVRQNLASGAQTVRIVDAGATGPLAITAAPLGTVRTVREDRESRSADRPWSRAPFRPRRSRNPHKKLTNHGYVGRPPAAPIE